jgi:hypothetical protein
MLGVGSRGYIFCSTLWDKNLERKWNLMNVYGAAQDEDKEGFLTELASMCLKNKGPLLLGGDFIIMRFCYEKNKPFLRYKFSRIFNSLIHLNELREVYVGGGQFTWTNNQKHPTLEKLDRIMMTGEWEKMFPTIQAYKAPREIFYHNPLILATRQPPKNRRDFRFETGWLKNNECMQRIQQIWEQPTRDEKCLDKVLFKLKKNKKKYQRLGVQ